MGFLARPSSPSFSTASRGTIPTLGSLLGSLARNGGRLGRLDLYGVAIERLNTLDRAKGKGGADVDETFNGVYDIICRNLALRALLEYLIAFLEVYSLADVENPSILVRRFPALCQVRSGFEAVLAHNHEGGS